MRIALLKRNIGPRRERASFGNRQHFRRGIDARDRGATPGQRNRCPAGARSDVQHRTLRDRLEANTRWFRGAIAQAGFDIKPGEHPIVPIMVHDAVKAQQLASRLLELGVYVVGFFYPVVPKGQARIRVQLSAVHEQDQLERAVAAFAKAGRELGIVG